MTAIAVSYDLASVTRSECFRLVVLASFPKARDPVLAYAVRTFFFGFWLAALGLLVGLPAAPQIGLGTMPVVCVALGLGLTALRMINVVNLTRRRLRPLGTLTAELGPDGLSRRFRYRATIDTWSGVSSIRTTRWDVVFRFQSQDVFWLPRRAFPSPEAYESFLAFAFKYQAAGARELAEEPELA